MMNVPSGLKQKDPKRGQSITILNHTDSSLAMEKKESAGKTPSAQQELGWENKFTLWKERLQATGTIKSFQDL
jgi:hypothetical protein